MAEIVNAADWATPAAQVSSYASAPREILGPPPILGTAFSGLLDDLDAHATIGGGQLDGLRLPPSPSVWDASRHGYVARHRRRHRFNYAQSTVGALEEREIIGGAVADMDPSVPEPQAYVTVEPLGLTLRGRYWRDGHFLVGVVSCQLGDRNFNVQARVDLRPLIAGLRRLRQQLVSGDDEFAGIFDSLGRTLKRTARSVTRPVRNLVNSVAHSKLLKKLGDGLRDVARSKLTGMAAGVAAALFPAAGVPIAAALAHTNKLFDAVEKAKAAKRQIERLATQGSRAAQALLRKGPLPAKLAAIFKQGQEAAKLIKATVAAARQGDPIAVKQAQVFQTVAQSRKALNQTAISGAHGRRPQKPRIHFQLRASDGRPLPPHLFPAMVRHRHRILSSHLRHYLR